MWNQTWEAGHRRYWVLNELSRRSLGSGKAGGPLPSIWRGGVVVAPTPTAAAGRARRCAFCGCLFQPPLGSPGPAPPLGCAGSRGGARRPRAAGGRAGEQAGGGLAAAGLRWLGLRVRSSTPTSPLPARPPCLPALCLCRGSLLTSLPSPSGWDLGAEPSGSLGPMQCRLLRGLAGVLLTLLCMGLLSLRYRSSPSPQRVPDTPELSPPSPRPSELQLHDVFIAVKTTQAFHHSRLELLLNTWVSRTREQVTSGGLRVPGVAPGLSAHRGLSTTDLGFSGGPTGEAALLPALPGLCSRSSFLPGWGSPAAVSPSLAQEPGTPQAHCLVFWGPGYSGLLRPFWGSLHSLVALEQA